MINQMIIGIDGGGTHSTALCVDRSGSYSDSLEGEGLNFVQDGLSCCARRAAE